MTDDDIQLVALLADAAGEAIRPFYRARFTIETKADASPVTQADRAAEAAIRALLAEHRPDDGVIGEESESGETQVWGEVVAEDPPSSIEFSWTLAWRADLPTHVRVEFEPTNAGATEVTFTHDGWARGAEGQAQYEKYSEWAMILGRYAAFFGRPREAVETLA